jgi:hypothetical protein
VTHQGSAEPVAGDLLPPEAAVLRSEVVSEPIVLEPPARHCGRCGVRCAAAVRMGFLRHRRLAPDRSIGANRTAGVDDHSP